MLGWLLLSTCLVLLAWLFSPRKLSSHHYPPGPVPLPVLGNLLNAPTKQQWKTYARWKSVYGDVISVTILGQRVVILNSLEATLDLLEKRSAIYADRPRMFMVCELLGWAQQLVFAPYGEHFRNMRKLLHKHLGGKGQLEKMEPYHELIEAASAGFLVRTLRDGSEFHRLHHNVHKTSGAVTLQIGYGYDVKEGHDELVQMMDDALLGFDAAAVPGTFLVDTIPALRWVPEWFPGAAWKRRAHKWRRLFVQMTETPYAMAKEHSSQGTGRDNIVSENLQEEMTPQYEYDLKMAVASLYGGGTDTTVAIIMSFILAMTLHPEAQKRAQQEIADVVGTDRLPLIRDREQLPYVQALISEVLRWNPIVPLGIPHRTTDDDIYRGYFIPKGSTIVVNMWHLHQDPNRYPEPETFNPERFLGPHPQPDIRAFLFGFGRRICPGLNLAEASIFASAARILAVFDIEKVVENGEVITPDFAFGTGAVSHPLPFKCSIKPRSKQAEALILGECK